MKLLILAVLAAMTPFGAMGADAKTDLCILCHGTNTNGNASIRAPKLAGLDGDYLRRQLLAFRAGIRGTHALDVSGSEMSIVAQSLSAAEISQVLEFLAKQKAEQPAATIDGNADRGRQLYTTCASCHGDRGKGNASVKAPALAQGSDWYWVAQLNNYRNGRRGALAGDDLGSVMRTAAQVLPNDQAVLDVVAYINTLR